MQQAWRERESIDRVYRAHEALLANKYCAVALVVVAEEQAPTIERAEHIFKVALKVAENNYQRTSLALSAAEMHDSGTSSSDAASQYSYRMQRSGSLSHSMPSTSSTASNSNKLIFNDVEDELNKVLKEMRSDLKLDHEPEEVRAEDVSRPKKVKFDKSKSDDKVSSYISNIITNFSKISPASTNQLLLEELKRDLNVIVYIKRRLAMCSRKMGRLKDAIKMYKDLTKEFPLINALNIHENLIEVYLESGAYTDAQNVLTKYDGMAQI
jgi:tetratricopeptide (TPR) repeat protein